MRSKQTRLQQILGILAVCFMLLISPTDSLLGQEATEDVNPTATPTVAAPTATSTTPPTDTATPTVEPSATATMTETSEPPTTEPEVTEAATDEAPEETVEATSSPQPTDAPAEPITEFSDDFESSDRTGWQISNWSVSDHPDGGRALLTGLPDASASVTALMLPNIEVSATFLIETNNIAEVLVNGYRVMVDSRGNSRLYQGTTLLETSPVATPTADLSQQPPAFVLTIRTFDRMLIVNVNGSDVIAHTAETPLLASPVTFRSGSANQGDVWVDNVMLRELTEAPVIPVFTPTPQPATSTPAPTATDEPTATQETPTVEDITDEPTPEATEEPTAEATEESTSEPTAEATDETAPEVTEEPGTDESPEVTEEPAAEVTEEPAAEVTEEPAAEVTEEPRPERPTDMLLANAPRKLRPGLGQAAQAIVNNDMAAARAALEDFFFEFDAQGRVYVELMTTEGFDDAFIQALVEEFGGTITATYKRRYEAYIPIEALVPLANSDEISAITQPVSASPTGPVGQAKLAPMGTSFSEAFNLIGAEPWHAASATGTGVNIAIIDVGFNGTATGPEFGCVANATPFGGTGSGDHGLAVAELICDIAPGSNVRFYTANNYGTLAQAVSAAAAAGPAQADVILITLDLGPSESPGDGTGFAGDGVVFAYDSDPYVEIANARQQGIPVIAAAGNNRYRYRVFSMNPDPAVDDVATIPVTAAAGDRISISWTDWTGYLNGPTIEDFDIEISFPGQTTTYFSFRGNEFSRPFTQVTVSSSACEVGVCNGTVRLIPHSGDSGTIFAHAQLIARDIGLTDQADNRSLGAVFGETPVRDGNGVITDYTLDPSTTVNDVTSGSLARPADSPDVITVGAVCADETNNFPLYKYSSIGPAYGPDGSTPTISGSAPFPLEQVKPDITSLTYVSTSASQASDCYGGAGGTSAAAAHVAGMIALLKSSANPSFSVFNQADAQAVDAIKNYLQTHATELPKTGGAANGADMTFGAGLTLLGAPNYNLSTTQTIPTPPDRGLPGGSCTGNYVYVSLANPYGVQDGSLSAPYSNLQYALDHAAANDCVVLMPGEYVGGVHVNNIAADVSLSSYDAVTIFDHPDSIIYSQGHYTVLQSPLTYEQQYTAAGSIAINNGTNPFMVYGLKFVTPALFNEPTDATPDRQPILVYNSDAITITGNTFGTFNANNVAYTGVTSASGSQILVAGSSGTIIENNTFSGITSTGLAGSPTVAVINSGTAAEPVVFRQNHVENNVANSDGSNEVFNSILHTDTSAVDIVNNAFIGNHAETIIRARTQGGNFATEQTTYPLNILGNVFLSNVTQTIDPVPAKPGPLVNGHYTPGISFINNTVVLNNLQASAGTGGSVLARGNGILGDPNGSISDPAYQGFGFYNNLIYNNTLPQGIISDTYISANDLACADLAGTGDAGVQHNWVFNSAAAPTQHGGHCADALTAPANNNFTSVPADFAEWTGEEVESHFAGYGTPLDRTTSPSYWALKQTDENTPLYSIGIDAGDASLVPGDYSVDFSGSDRVIGIGGWEYPHDGDNNFTTDSSAYAVDIGAFEYTELTISVNPHTITVTEDAGPYVFDMITPANLPQALVQGSVGNVTIEILSKPDDYGIHCGAQFTDENQGMYVAGRYVWYCPPQDFYTDPAEDPSNDWPDTLDFEYRVTDETGKFVDGVVNITVDAQTDPALTATIGNNPEEPFVMRLNITDSNSVRLRPHVEFGNFRHSERANPDFRTGGELQAEFPYTYSNINVSDPDNVLDTWNLNEGVFEVESTYVTGEAIVTYDVTDATTSTTTNNTLIVRVGTQIAEEPGIYDDSSFAFNYEAADGSPGGWTAATDHSAINNTLHTTNRANDKATFEFIGTGFTLYMKSTYAGNDYSMEIINNTDETPVSYTADAPWATIAGSTTIKQTTFGPGTCQTSQPTNGTNISNRGPNAFYTVTCTGYNYGKYAVTLTNLFQYGLLQIDGFGLIDETAALTPIGPGMHDIDEPEIRAIFTQPGSTWTETWEYLLSKRIAFQTISNGADPLTFEIQGGRGLVIGTVLQENAATYTICAENQTTGAKTCHSYNNDPLPWTPTTYNVHRPLYGLDPQDAYTVTIQDITVPANGRLVIDSINVLPPSERTNVTLDNGMVEDDQTDEILFSGGVDDSWNYNYNDARYSNRSITRIAPGIPAIGPFIALNVEASVDGFMWKYEYNFQNTMEAYICVDRARGIDDGSTDPAGNCLLVDTRNGTAQPVDINGTPDGTPIDIALLRGTLLIEESMFRDVWGDVDRSGTVGDHAVESDSAPHTVEIFSTLNSPFSLDNVTLIASGEPLPAGRYEEYASNFNYYDSSFTDVTDSIQTSESYAVSAYTGEWTRVINAPAASDSGSGSMFTSTPGNSIAFSVEGTGLTANFRFNRFSDAVKLCWLADADVDGSVTPVAREVLEEGNCQIEDNEDPRTLTRMGRTVSGLPYGTYHVAIQMLPDNFSPAAHPVWNQPLQMWFDGIEVHDTGWEELTQLEGGQRYETNYNNREADNLFRYIGANWFHRIAGQRSANNYDDVYNTPGVGIEFRTNNANAITYLRQLAYGSSPARICAAPEANPSQRTCAVISNEGYGTQRATTFYLNDTGNTAPHIVTITAAGFGYFNVDAIEPVDTTQPLLSGTYEDDHPAIKYDLDASLNYVPDGAFESDATFYWSPIGSATAQRYGLRHSGRFSAQVITAAPGDGIASEPFDLPAGDFTFQTRIMMTAVADTSLTVELVQLDGANNPIGTLSTETLNVTSTEYGRRYQWQTLRSDVEIASGTRARVEVTASTGVTFYVDDVLVSSGGMWEPMFNNIFGGARVTRAVVPGSSAEFTFEGNGFGVTTVLDTRSGETEICYAAGTSTPDPSDPGTHCFTYKNESGPMFTNITRTVTGLPYGVYTVRVRDVEDGYTDLSVNPFQGRNPYFSTGSVAIDAIEVYDHTLPIPIPESVKANEDYLTGGKAALLTIPADRWQKVTGYAGARYSNGSYYTVTNAQGAPSAREAGPTAMMTLDLNTYDQATVVIDSGFASYSASTQLLICVDEVNGTITYDNATGTYDLVDSDNCHLTDTLRTSSQAVVSPQQIAALGTPGAERVLSVRSLSASQLHIDGIQVIYGSSLTEGYYENSIGITDSGNGLLQVADESQWSTLNNALFSGGDALQTATNGETLSFDFTGTGFTLVSRFEPNGGVIDISVSGGDLGAPITRSLDTSHPFAVWKAANTIAGLPHNDYTVTLTADTSGGGTVTFDGVQVYGDLNNLGSLYDDAQKAADGTPIFFYGPVNNTWTPVSGIRAGAQLNQTHHETRTVGATVAFEIGLAEGDATGLVLYYGAASYSSVDICFREQNAPYEEICGNVAINDGVGRKVINRNTPGFSALNEFGDHYAVTISNAQVNGYVVFDAIQVIEVDEELTEGIYDVPYLDGIGMFSGNGWSVNMYAKEATGAKNAELTFDMLGTGFAVQFREGGTGTTDTYEVCIDDGTGATCENVASTNTWGARAITRVGLHDTDGSEKAYTVTIRNADSGSRNMIVNSIHVLGTRADYALNINETADNKDPALTYLPFGSLTDVEYRIVGGPSNDSEHRGRMPGATAYFEFTPESSGTSGFAYIRQSRGYYGDVELCVGGIGTSDVECETINNNEGNAFGYITLFLPDASFDCGVNGCWGSITSLSNTEFPVDGVRIINDQSPLTAGFYDNSFALLEDFDAPSVETVSIYGTSGGTVRRYTDIDSGMSFRMTGTSVSVMFRRDRYADSVDICYAPYTGTETYMDALNGTCANYDNETPAIYNTSARRITGLPYGDYIVAVRMNEDNLDPLPHAVFSQPVRMEIDAIEIGDEQWLAPDATNWLADADLAAIGPGSRHETNFNRADTANKFLYYGSWITVEGPVAWQYSGSNYDRTFEQGATVVFRTTGANGMTLYRDVRGGAAPMRICATPVDVAGGGSDVAISGETFCQDFMNDGGYGVQQAVGFRFGDTIDEYVVSVSTLEPRYFVLDAIELFDATAPMNAGLFEATSPYIEYDSEYTNLVPDGSAELVDSWTDFGSPNINQIAPNRFEGLRSRLVNADSGNGTQIENIPLENGKTYTFIARAYVLSGGVRASMSNGGTFSSTDMVAGDIRYQWVTMRQDFTWESNSPAALRFLATANSSQFYIDSVKIFEGGVWQSQHSPIYSDSSIMLSRTNGATADFTFTGTGFEIGLLVNNRGGEVEICYESGSIDESCMTFQQESWGQSTTTSRTITGLPQDTYTVTVREVDDGKTVTRYGLPDWPRLPYLGVAQVGVDYVRIYDDAPPPALSSGTYDNAATDDNGTPYLQLVPEDRWITVTGWAANAFSEQNYASVADAYDRRTQLYPGPTAILNVDVPETGATVVVSTGRASIINAQQVLICGGDERTGEIEWTGQGYVLNGGEGQCVLRTNLATESQIIIGPDDLDVLSTAGEHQITLTSLANGYFDIDGFQIMSGQTLAAGLYDEFLPDNVIDFNTPTSTEINRASYGCNPYENWCVRRDARTINGTYAFTRQTDATITFDAVGTGFSVINSVDNIGAEMRVCYKRSTNPNPFPTIAQTLDASGNEIWNNETQNMAQDGIWCDIHTTNTNNNAGVRFGWLNRNEGRNNPYFGIQYGFAYYGLPLGEYTVEVRMVDPNEGNWRELKVDGFAVFDEPDANSALTPGFYDDKEAGIKFEPASHWSEQIIQINPPYGPYNQAESFTTNAGALAQFSVNGNAFTLYQTFDYANSSDVSVCLVDRDTVIHCTELAEGTSDRPYSNGAQVTNMSQRGVRKPFTPVMFFGLGSGEHDIILENRDHNRRMMLDGISVQP